MVSKSTFRFFKLMIALILTEVQLSYLVYIFVSTIPRYKGPHSIRRAMLSYGNSCLFVHDYLFDDPTTLECISKGFQVFYYIFGPKVTDLVSLIFGM